MSYAAQNPKAPDTLWQVFTLAAHAYKAKFWTALPLAILLLALAWITSAFYATHPIPHMFQNFSDFVHAHKAMEIGFFILFFILKLFLSGALIFQYAAGVQKSLGLTQTPGLFGLFRSLKNMPFAIITSIFAMILITIGMLFALHPGMILMVYFSMITPVVFLEGNNPVQALKISACLVHQNFWKTVLVNLIITGLVIGFAELWKDHHLSIWLRDIFGLIDLLVIGFFASVSVTFYQYLNKRLANPLRQKLYQALRHRPRSIKWAAFLTFVYVLISFVAFALLALQLAAPHAIDDLDNFYSLLDSLIATNLMLGLSIVFMTFAYFGGPIARIFMIIFSVFISVLSITHLFMAALDFHDFYLNGAMFYPYIIAPVLTLILNILIIVLMARSGAWYRELRALQHVKPFE